MSRTSPRHRKQPRVSPARPRKASRHRKPSPVASVLQHKPALIAAAVAGSTLIATAASATMTHQPGAAPRPAGLDRADALSSLPAAANGGTSASLPFGLRPGRATSAYLLVRPSASAQPGAQPTATPAADRTPAQSTPASGAAKPTQRQQSRKAPAPPVYRNPLRSVSGLLPERIDMGVDFGGSGPVYALGNAVITSATGDCAGWPGGGWITYRLTSGPAAGLMVYLAEDVKPTVQAGQTVSSSTVIATMFNGGAGIETGWAQPSGNSAESQLPEAGSISGGGPFPTKVGLNFEELLQALGVPAALNRSQTASGILPPNYPTSWTAATAPQGLAPPRASRQAPTTGPGTAADDRDAGCPPAPATGADTVMAVKVLRAEVNGHAARAGELRPLALANYGHFTVMQVRSQAVRGLGRHLARLDAATRELYGTGLDGARVRAHIRHALGAEIADATVRVTVFQPDPGAEPSVLVTLRPPAEAPTRPQRLQPVAYQRPAAHIKHTGTFGQIYYGLLAERNGFDDALLTDGDGIVSESAIANLGCCRDDVVTWPDAPALHGITMQLLEQALPGAGLSSRRGPIRLADLNSYDAVFLANSSGIAPVGLVGDQALPTAGEIMKTLAGAYQRIGWDPI